MSLKHQTGGDKARCKALIMAELRLKERGEVKNVCRGGGHQTHLVLVPGSVGGDWRRMQRMKRGRWSRWMGMKLGVGGCGETERA